MTMINGKKEAEGMIIKIKYFNKEISRLGKIEKGDWIDLRCAVPGGVTIKAGGDAIIKLGVGMILPDNYEKAEMQDILEKFEAKGIECFIARKGFNCTESRKNR